MKRFTNLRLCISLFEEQHRQGLFGGQAVAECRLMIKQWWTRGKVGKVEGRVDRVNSSRGQKRKLWSKTVQTSRRISM